MKLKEGNKWQNDVKGMYFYGKQFVLSGTSTCRVFVFLFWLAILYFSPICQENLSKPSQCRLTLPCKCNIFQQDCRELLYTKIDTAFFISISLQWSNKSFENQNHKSFTLNFIPYFENWKVVLFNALLAGMHLKLPW